MKKLITTLVTAALALFAVAANADYIEAVEGFNPVLQVDGSSSSVTLNFGVHGSIDELIVGIEFTKCDDPISSTGECQGTNFSYNREIVFSLISPTGTVVSLIAEDTYSGQTPGARVYIVFSDDFATTVGGNTLVGGNFAPVGSLSDFDGENLFGDWTLYFEDTVGLDPMSLNWWGVGINYTVPEPGTLALFGIGLFGIGMARRRKTV